MDIVIAIIVNKRRNVVLMSLYNYMDTVLVSLCNWIISLGGAVIASRTSVRNHQAKDYSL